MTDRQGVISVIKEFHNNIVSKKTFWIPVLIFTLYAFGFSLTRNSLSVDDMSQDVYNGIDGLSVRSLRWGMELWNIIFGVSGYSPFIYKFLGVLFLVLAAIIMCSIFYSLSNKKLVVYEPPQIV